MFHFCLAAICSIFPSLIKWERMNALRTMIHSTQKLLWKAQSMCIYLMFLWFRYAFACASDQESTSLICIISAFVISHLSSPFSLLPLLPLLPLPPLIFDHYGMKNVTEPYVNSWSYQCKFLTFFRGGEFLACTISLCSVFISHNVAFF